MKNDFDFSTLLKQFQNIFS